MWLKWHGRGLWRQCPPKLFSNYVSFAYTSVRFYSCLILALGYAHGDHISADTNHTARRGGLCSGRQCCVVVAVASIFFADVLKPDEGIAKGFT